jgi:hypothetical protein
MRTDAVCRTTARRRTRRRLGRSSLARFAPKRSSAFVLSASTDNRRSGIAMGSITAQTDENAKATAVAEVASCKSRLSRPPQPNDLVQCFKRPSPESQFRLSASSQIAPSPTPRHNKAARLLRSHPRSLHKSRVLRLLLLPRSHGKRAFYPLPSHKSSERLRQRRPLCRLSSPVRPTRKRPSKSQPHCLLCKRKQAPSWKRTVRPPSPFSQHTARRWSAAWRNPRMQLPMQSPLLDSASSSKLVLVSRLSSRV